MVCVQFKFCCAVVIGVNQYFSRDSIVTSFQDKGASRVEESLNGSVTGGRIKCPEFSMMEMNRSIRGFHASAFSGYGLRCQDNRASRNQPCYERSNWVAYMSNDATVSTLQVDIIKEDVLPKPTEQLREIWQIRLEFLDIQIIGCV